MKKIIGFVGPICSGKDTAGDYASIKLQIPHYQISEPLIEEARKREIPLTRKAITSFGTALAKERGGDYLARVLLGRIEQEGVISGMRQLEQISYLRSNSVLTLISVDCPKKLRFERAIARKKIAEALTPAEFIRDEIEENSGENIQGVFECMRLAEYQITNDSGLDNLYEQVDKILRERQ